MQFALGALLCVAVALFPATPASAGPTFASERLIRRDGDNGPKRNPEFGRLLANEYLIHQGAGMPEPKDIHKAYPECQWRHYAGSWAWLDENNVQCYLSPSYKYHAQSIAKPMNATLSYKAGACADTPNPEGYPDHLPKYTIAVPYLYFNNLYDRRCKVRAMVKIPTTDQGKGGWVQAWVQEHDGGFWDENGVENEQAPQQGILVDTDMYKKFFHKGQVDKGVVPCPVEWFFLDINTLQ